MRGAAPERRRGRGQEGGSWPLPQLQLCRPFGQAKSYTPYDVRSLAEQRPEPENPGLVVSLQLNTRAEAKGCSSPMSSTAERPGQPKDTPARSVPRGLGWRALLEHPDKGSGLEEVHASFSADPLLRHGNVRAVVHLEDVCEVLEVQGSGTPPVKCRMLARVEAVLLRLLPRCGRRSRRAPSPASPPRPRPACSSRLPTPSGAASSTASFSGLR